VGKVQFHLARMHRAVRLHIGQHLDGLAPRVGVPRAPGLARVHEREVLARQEAVVDQAVFLDGQARVAAFEIAGAVVLHAVAQREVLRACRRPDGVGLHEAESADRGGQRGRLEEGACDGVAAQVVEGRVSHAAHCSIRGWFSLLRCSGAVQGALPATVCLVSRMSPASLLLYFAKQGTPSPGAFSSALAIGREPAE
jgi:hypothetical protein